MPSINGHFTNLCLISSSTMRLQKLHTTAVWEGTVTHNLAQNANLCGAIPLPYREYKEQGTRTDRLTNPLKITDIH